MTTCVYSKRHKAIAADRRNTDSAGMGWSVNKIEVLPNGYIFLGSGHLYTIAQCKHWAHKSLWNTRDVPDWSYLLEDPDDRGFQCLLISPDGQAVQMVNGELTPAPVEGELFAIGSGAAYALGALEAGASPATAVEIAAMYDSGTGGGVDLFYFE